MVVLVCRDNYKCCWDGQIVHVLLVDGAMLTIKEADLK
jgi:hypothetical protein